MKKILTALLAVALLFSLVACGEDSNSGTTPTSSGTAIAEEQAGVGTSSPESTEEALENEDPNNNNGGVAGSSLDDYIKSLIDYAGVKTVDGQSLVYYTATSQLVVLVVCRIDQEKPQECDVWIYQGLPVKDEYTWYVNHKESVFSPDQIAKYNFVDSVQCFWELSENEHTATRQELAKGGNTVIVK